MQQQLEEEIKVYLKDKNKCSLKELREYLEEKFNLKLGRYKDLLKTTVKSVICEQTSANTINTQIPTIVQEKKRKTQNPTVEKNKSQKTTSTSRIHDSSPLVNFPTYYISNDQNKMDCTQNICQKHQNQQKNFFCVIDKIRCCKDCFSEHKNHELKPLNDVISEFKEKLKKIEFKTLNNEFEKKKIEIEQQIVELDKEKRKLFRSKKNFEIKQKAIQETKKVIENESSIETIVKFIDFWNKQLEQPIIELTTKTNTICNPNSSFQKRRLFSIKLPKKGEKHSTDAIFKEISFFHDKGIQMVKCGVANVFVLCGLFFI